MASPELLLVLAFYLLITALGVAAQYPTRPQAPGVAFELTPDYGLAAIYLKNGRSIPIAQIQGSPAYQDFMRKKTTSTNTGDSTLCRLLSSKLYHLKSAMGLHVDICRNADFTSTKALLGTLKTAVESYLGTNICFASLAVDDVEYQHEINVAQEALQALHLRQVLPTVRAEKQSILTHRPDMSPKFDEEPWYILAVDYSLHWFNVGLYTTSEGLVDPVEGFVSSRKVDENDQLQALKDTLGRLFSGPPPNVMLPKDIRYLIVYGDDAKNTTLHRLLVEKLGTDLVRDARMSSSIYDGPLNMAEVMFETMDTVDFEMNVRSPYCQWRSRLYGDRSANEL